MQVSLTIIRYPRLYIPFAFVAMAIHHIPLWLNKHISFYKLLGTGKNGTFDTIPDLRQWGILTVNRSQTENLGPVLFNKESAPTPKELYGYFISRWFQIFNCEIFTIILEPIEGHGLWDGKEVFGKLPRSSFIQGPIAILTRATIRFNKLPAFWKNVKPVAKKLKTAKGLIHSIGIGELPWIKQVTFSIWETKEDMLSFAYGMNEHTDVINKTRDQQWFKEEMFIRFKITGYTGSIDGKDPLKLNM